MIWVGSSERGNPQIPKYDRRFSQRNCNLGAFQRIPSVGLYITILPQMNSDVIYQQIVIMVLSAPTNLTHLRPRN